MSQAVAKKRFSVGVRTGATGSFVAHLLVAGAIFVPGHLASWWIERAYVAAGVLAAVLLIISQPIRTVQRPWMLISGLGIASLLTALYVTSHLRALSYGGSTGLRDYIELPRYLISFLLIFLLHEYSSESLGRFGSFLLRASICYALALALIMYLQIDPVHHWVAVLYADTKTHIEGSWIRLAIPFENPNFLAFHSTVALTFFLFSAPGRGSVLWPLMALAVIGLTGSRTGWVVSSFVIILYLLATLMLFRSAAGKRRRRRAVILLIALVVASFTLAGAVQKMGRVADTAAAFNSGGVLADGSVRERLDMMYIAAHYINERPAIGWGPAKYETLAVVDNQLMLWLLRHGFLGASLILLALLLWFCANVRQAQGGYAKAGICVLWAALLLLLQAGAFLDNFRLLVIFSFAAAIGSRISISSAERSSV